MKKRMLSALLCLCMMLTMMPAAFAANTEESTTKTVSTASELKDALSKATSGTTIQLTADITVNNTDLAETAAAVKIPAGVTLDGNTYSISADTNWAKGNSHIVSVESATDYGVQTTIKNLTVIGNDNTKSGIHVYNSKGVTLKDVTIQNCAEAGLLVNGSEVTATGLTTSGNGWGAVNVDKQGASLDLEGANLSEDVEVWTELPELPIKVDGFEKVIGYGNRQDATGLKGYTYYTTNMSKLGEVYTVNADTNSITVYENIEQAVAANTAINLLKDVEIERPLNITVPGVTINGDGYDIVYTGAEIGSMILVQDNNTALNNVTLNTNGKTNHGVQFYCVEGGSLNGVTVNGGAYTSVLVNGSKVSVTDSTMTPDEKAYASIEYGMGGGVTTMPEIELKGVEGKPGVALVYVDQTTINNIKANVAELNNATINEVVAAINETLSGDDNIKLSVGDDGEIIEPVRYDVTFDAGEGAFANEQSTKRVPTNYSGELDVDSVEKPTRSGYDFEGWANEAEEEVSSTYTFTADTTLHAVWDRSSSGGSSGGSSSSGYAVSVASGIDNGKVTVSPKNASKGATVTITVTPDEGYELGTLTVTDKDGNKISVTDKGNGKYTFTMPDGKVTVSATFTAVEEVPEQVGSFTDVDTADWFAEAVQYMLDNKMMNGITDTTFGPDNTTTRGMIVTILYRLEGEPDAAASNFTDVAANMYYADAVAWAQANNIVNGITTTTFGPDNAITREQMAAILYRYAQFKGYDVTASNDLSSYTDASRISAYATTAMQWANAEGLITGNTTTTINPIGNATRAEVATILMRFCENIVG